MQDNFMKYIEYLFVTGQLDEMDNEQISEIANELFNDDESLDNDDNSLKRYGVNYLDKLNYEKYIDYEDFKSKNPGKYYFFTRYGKKDHTKIGRAHV